MKTCPQCERDLPLDAFDTRRGGRPQSWCRACQSSRARKRRTISVTPVHHEQLTELARVKGVPLSVVTAAVIDIGVAHISPDPSSLEPRRVA